MKLITDFITGTPIIPIERVDDEFFNQEPFIMVLMEKTKDSKNSACIDWVPVFALSCEKSIYESPTKTELIMELFEAVGILNHPASGENPHCHGIVRNLIKNTYPDFCLGFISKRFYKNIEMICLQLRQSNTSTGILNSLRMNLGYYSNFQRDAAFYEPFSAKYPVAFRDAFNIMTTLLFALSSSNMMFCRSQVLDTKNLSKATKMDTLIQRERVINCARIQQIVKQDHHHAVAIQIEDHSIIRIQPVNSEEEAISCLELASKERLDAYKEYGNFYIRPKHERSLLNNPILIQNADGAVVWAGVALSCSLPYVTFRLSNTAVLERFYSDSLAEAVRKANTVISNLLNHMNVFDQGALRYAKYDFATEDSLYGWIDIEGNEEDIFIIRAF